MTRRLVVFAPNWLGDAVMALPALSAVRQTWPDASIDVVARASVAPFFSLVPDLGRAVVLPDGSAGVVALRGGQYDVALLLTNSFHTARLARAAAIPERWGYRADLRSWLLTRAVRRPLRLHQVEYYRTLVEHLGFTGGPTDPRIVLDEAHRADGARVLSASGWSGVAPLVAMAPGAAFGSAKRWPAVSFARVADRLAAEGMQPLLVGGPGDRAAGDELLAALEPVTRTIDLIGRTTIPELAATLSHCRGMVTNDSGAMHLAAALGLSVTVMFGPTREHETVPRGPGRHALLTHPVWCRPCMLRECPLTHRCMTGISVDAVHAATVSLQ